MAEASGAGGSGGFTELLNLSMPATAESISAITGSISEVLERKGIPEQKRLEIDLAVQEALANAVVHGCKGDASKTIECKMNSDRDGRIVISVTDPGPGFKPESVPDPKRSEGLHVDHGRGVYLIRELMDQVQFERGGSQIKMWKY